MSNRKATWIENFAARCTRPRPHLFAIARSKGFGRMNLMAKNKPKHQTAQNPGNKQPQSSQDYS